MTTIRITPPGGSQQTLETFEQCTVNPSCTSKAGSCALELKQFDSDLIDAFKVGSDVQIEQAGYKFRGWVKNPPKTLNGLVRTLSYSILDYTAKTQKIVVAESYVNKTISYIVNDLFSKYVSWATRTNIETCSRTLTISFGDKFLFDCIEQLAELASYEWYIDSDLDVNFFGSSTRTNENVMENGTYHKGTASFTPNADNLVNKLWVKGGKDLSDPFTQNITVGTEPISLLYTPRVSDDLTGITITVDGSVKTLGIQYMHDSGTYDFLINSNEKLLIPDLCTSGTGTITYCYEYPIKLLFEDLVSQNTYGIFEDILNVDTGDKEIARDLGLQHLNKYKDPVVTGSIKPFSGVYYPGELLSINIPKLNMGEQLAIKEVTYTSRAKTSTVDIKLQLETPERTVQTILKDLNSRLAKIEKTVYSDSDGPVEKYKVFKDTFVCPTMSESMTYVLHRYHVCSESLICSESLVI